MKQLSFLILTLFFTLASSNINLHAQIQPQIPEAFDLYLSDGNPAEDIVPNMRYRELKKIYHHNDYKPALGDRYNPALSGVSSFFIPGLGQIISHQNHRGIAQLAIAGTFAVVGGATGQIGYMYDSPELIITSLCASCIVLSLQIYSCVDATRVARVMNMYERDLQKKNIIEFNLQPSLSTMNLGHTQKIIPGMTLAMRF